MNDEDLQVQFKVIGIFGAPRNMFTLGTYNCIREAQIIVDTWKDDPQYKFTMFEELKIVKHSQVTVRTVPQHVSNAPDYERVGVVRDDVTSGISTAELQDLREIVEHLEDRHVGLRHELLLDMEALQDNVEDLREDAGSAAAAIDNLDGGMRHEVAGLRREMESLRSEVAEMRSTHAGPAERNNHDQWRKQQVLDRLATEGSK